MAVCLTSPCEAQEHSNTVARRPLLPGNKEDSYQCFQETKGFLDQADFTLMAGVGELGTDGLSLVPGKRTTSLTNKFLPLPHPLHSEAPTLVASLP